MDQLERIAYMEQILDEVSAAVDQLKEGLEGYQSLQSKLEELVEYYEGPLWRADFEDDCAGKLPAGLKRGVLSEDAVYDLLTENSHLMEKCRKMGQKP